FPKHPLEDQARWLAEEQGATISKKTMDYLQELQKIGHEHNQSFVDLVVGELRGREVGKKLEIEQTGDPLTVVDLLEKPGQGAHDLLAETTTRLVDLRSRLGNAPGDLRAVREAAETYQDLGQRSLKADQPRQGAEALRESVRLRERLARDHPAEQKDRRVLAETLLWLAKAHVQLRQFED